MIEAQAAPASLRRRVALPALAVGLVGVAILALGWIVDSQQFFQAYLVAYVFWLSIPVGSLGILMIQFMTGGIWGLAARRVLESSVATLLPMAVLFVPLLFGLSHLYVWAQAEVVAQDEKLLHKAVYLNQSFFIGRVVLYFAIWLALSYLLMRWSAAHDRTGDPQLMARMKKVSTGGVIALGLSASFAAMDWLMSLEPLWYSSVYGAIVSMGMILTAFAFTVLALTALREQPPLARLASPQLFNDLGSLLLAFLMLWTYMAFFQFLLIWVGNLSEEIPWYLRRIYGPWQPVAVAVALGGFALPFFVLLFRGLKRNPRTLAIVAGYLLVTRLIDLFWTIEPALRQSGAIVRWLDPVAVVGLGGLWLAVFARQLTLRPLVPPHDPRRLSRQESEHGSR